MLEYEVVKKADLPPENRLKPVGHSAWAEIIDALPMLRPGECLRVNLRHRSYRAAYVSVHSAATRRGVAVSVALRGDWLWIFQRRTNAWRSRNSGKSAKAN
ncbi:MAG: hypothetical protein ABFD89_26580 [Bryobacteraceae bacterium]